LEVDIGLEKPAPLNVKIGIEALRAQLCDGKPISGTEIAEYYCIHPSDSLSVRLTRIDRGCGEIDGWLSDSQIDLFAESISLGLEQVRVYDCTRRRLELALNKQKLERDVISTESATLTTHSVICKLGTNAVGLIPKLGGALRKSELKPFLPKKIASQCRPW
jgi:hypothetical protein